MNYQPTTDELQAAFCVFDWIAMMRPEIDRRKRMAAEAAEKAKEKQDAVAAVTANFSCVSRDAPISRY